jgi:hypothetical protein
MFHPQANHTLMVIGNGSINPSTRAPALAGGSCSGFRPTGVLESATGLPVGLHIHAQSSYF